MISNATKYLVSDIFGTENQIRYVIPKYQREYTWRKENWEELYNDIFDSETNHFIGSIICIKTDSDALAPELELVDGQQRLTTLSLLFVAIYKSLHDINGTDDDSKFELKNLERQIINKNTHDTKIELSRQNHNNEDYLSVLNDAHILEYDQHDNNKNKGNRIIYRCYRYFLNRLQGIQYADLINLKDKINLTLLVKIEVDSHSDAFILFESLNNRGTPLSAIDLIKNKVLAEFDRNGAISVDEAFHKWNIIIDNLQDYTVQERFLRQYYNAFKVDTDRIKVPNITKATRSNLIKIYEVLIGRDSEYIFDDIIKKSSLYHDLLFPNEANNSICKNIASELIDLTNVKASPAYTLLLFLLSSYPDKEIDFYKEIVNFLVKYFVRRNITDFPNTRNLDKIFIDLIEKIYVMNEDDIDTEYIIDYLSDEDRMSRDEIFQKSLYSDLYEVNVDATRFILSKIEESKSTREIYLNFWTRDKSNKLVWTIEHIFPEGVNIPNAWVDMIADGNEVNAIEIQSRCVHKLGNLTLTGYNQHLSNFAFEKKRDRKDSKDSYIGYKNGLFLNEDLKNRNKWTEDNIKERTDKIVTLAMNIFSV